MTKVVLDTNIIVSANLHPAGLPAIVLRLAANLKIQMCVSPAILAEYETVLRRPKFKFGREHIEAVLQLLRDTSLLLTELPAVTRSRHEEDNRFLECAEAAGADYLITGNLKHFPADKRWKTTQIVSPRELLDILGPRLRLPPFFSQPAL